MDLIQLIYVSSAIRELSDRELDEILVSSVKHNTAQGITGMLLYSAGNFMQVIEGPASAIDETYARICADPRHRHIFLLSRESAEQRLFPAWHMGFHRLTQADAAAHPAFAPLFADGFNATRIGAEAGLATDLLKQFSKLH